jgi:hypothetical protein
MSSTPGGERVPEARPEQQKLNVTSGGLKVRILHTLSDFYRLFEFLLEHNLT